MGEGESGSIFLVPEELSFTLFSEGERKSSSIFFVRGGRGGTSDCGCPGAVVAPWGQQSLRAVGSLLPSIASVALPEMLSSGMHRTATFGHRYMCCIQPRRHPIA